MKRELNDLMGFDHVVRVHPDGRVTDAEPGWYAPEVYVNVDEDGQCLADSDEELYRIVSPWRLMTGYTGQYAYHGPVMHASEFIGGRMEQDIRERPGVYVACVVECLGPFEGEDDPRNAELEEEPAGWVVCYQLDEDKDGNESKQEVPRHHNDLGDYCPRSGERTADGTCPVYCREADEITGFDAGRDEDTEENENESEDKA